MENKPPFEELIPAIEAQIDKRKGNWRLASVSWEDAAQIILTRVFVKYHTFNPSKGEFSHWLSRLITRTMINILRDNFQKWSRPCIQGCVFNTGNDTCSKTKSGKQCDECPLFKKWKSRKESHFNVKQTLPLDNHLKEANSIQSSFIDIASIKSVIDVKIKEKLNKHEYEIYKMLYIQDLDEKEVGKLLKYRKVGKMYHGYQNILKVKKIIVAKAKEIIAEQGLTDE